MTSKISIDNRELLQKSVSEKLLLGLILAMQLSANWLHSGWPQWTASRWEKLLRSATRCWSNGTRTEEGAKLYTTPQAPVMPFGFT
jgi:hypothetical protein